MFFCFFSQIERDRRVLMDYYLLIYAYLLGAIPFSLIIGLVWFKKDLRNEGSGNLGTTNTFRSLGKKAGFIVMILDISKGFFAVYLPDMLGTELPLLVYGGVAIIGHALSIFIRFKGGKSVATTAGVFIYCEPILFVIGFVSFFVVLKLSKFVSLSSVIAIFIVGVTSVFISDVITSSFLCMVNVFIIYKHRENFKRIKAKNEPKIKWM